jgi:RimJ/RimL family protein N-acetyltransferase
VDKILELSTPRLLLRAATPEMARADERRDAVELRQLVGAFVPQDWPPALYGEDRARFISAHAATPDRLGWHGWYFSLAGEKALMGVASVTWPSPEGDVEAGYAILDRYRGQGYTPEAINALIDWAFKNPQVRRIVAHTFPHYIPALRVLEKAGFTRALLTSDGICEYEKRRPGAVVDSPQGRP